MKINKTTLILIGIILLLIAGWWIHTNLLENKLEEERTALRTEKIRNDSLVQVTETQWRKLVADTLTQRELQREVAKLKMDIAAKPKIVYRIVFVPKEVEKPVDSVIVEGDSIHIIDHYPQKENYFVRYSNKLSLSEQSGIGKFEFSPFNVNIVISQRADGVFQSDIQVPPWLTVGEVDIQATPMTQPKPNNFGLILGAGAGTEFLTGDGYGRLVGGLRFRKVYLDLGVNTNLSGDAVIKFEF